MHFLRIRLRKGGFYASEAAHEKRTDLPVLLVVTVGR